MYGFIYNTLRSLVVENHGEEVWKELCTSVGAEEIIDGILDHHYYDETMVYRLVVAASEKLGVSNEVVLKSFGHFFFKTCKNTGHSSMLRTLGHDLHGFLMNLDSLHDHLAFTYTQMAAPSFRCEKTQTGLTLHYHSQRTGLDSIVCGIVQEVAKDFYNLDVTVTRTSYEENTTSLPHHYVFSIEATENTDENLERLIGEVNTLHTGQHNSAPLTPLADDVEMSFEQSPLLLSTYAPPNIAEDSQQILGCPMAMAANRSHSTGQMITADQQLQLMGENPDHALTQDGVVDSKSPVADLALAQDGIANPKSPIPDTEETSGLRVQLRNHPKMLPNSILPALPGASRIASRRGSTVPGDFVNWPITPHIFATCFPFHIIFDFNLTIRYMGISLSRILPRAICSEAKLTDYFNLSRPSVPLTYKNIRESIHNIFILCTKQAMTAATSKTAKDGKEAKDALQFRGQMIPTSSKDANCQILFLASPRISTIEELEHIGLYLSDIPIHDVTRDLLLLNRHFRVEMNIATELEKTKKELQEQKSAVEKEKKRADDLLHAMLPRSVADELISGKEARATDYSMVTILFSDIKGFTTICNQCQPLQVVGMLNNLYTLFDALLEKNNVYKVETIGDAYMVAAGLLDTSKQHAQAVTNQAFGMREEAGKVMEPVNDKSPIQIRIGIHSGPVVAGVVGKKMPRFCLFGDTVNTASRMESHGEPGYVHISEATYNEMKGSPYIFYSRGKINVKGLGDRQTYFVEPPSSEVKPHLDLVRNDSEGSSSAIPIINVDEVQSTSIKKEDVSRSPSFVTYNKCTMVTTPSVQFIHTSPSNPNFENDESSQDRPDRVSGEGLIMCRPSVSASAENSPMPTPRNSSIDSPDTQIRKNKVAPHKTISKIELRPPPPTIEEVSESGRSSRNSNNSISVIDAFISKNGTAANGGTSVDRTTVASTTANNQQSVQENSSPDQSESGDSSGSEKSNKRAKGGKCVIS